MFDALTGLGWGVVTFAITIGIGTIVLSKFGGALATCADVGGTGYTYEGNITLEPANAELCINDTSSDVGSYTPTAYGWTTTNYLYGQLGTSGLAGWTPAIIAFTVGMLFLGGFLVNKGKGRSY